jgi:hypothetical protein
MNREMIEDYTRLVRLMREIMNEWPEAGIMMIMKAEQEVIRSDAEAVASWAESKTKKP